MSAGPQEPTPEERRAELEELRGQVGDTVEQLAHRADVPAQVRARGEETHEQIKAQVAHGRRMLADRAPGLDRALKDKAPGLDRAIDEQPLLVAGGAVFGLWLLWPLLKLPVRLLLVGARRRGDPN